jgi:4-diphosphocytidyl-2-C-methyl-D-erythritol kinase
MAGIALKARAKVNLGLRVLGLRPDGYHEVETLLAPIAEADEVAVEIRGESGVALEVRGPDLGPAESNLAVLASRAYLAQAGVEAGVRIRLVKRLPVGAGLGGGSADAAAVLRAMAQLRPAGVDLHSLARNLGADVPGALLGRPAIARGIGHDLTPVELPERWLVVAWPGEVVAAAQAYRWWDADGASEAPPAAWVAEDLAQARKPDLTNDLQAPVARRVAAVGRALERLAESGLTPAMSGSGAAVYALTSGQEEAVTVRDRLAWSEPTWWVRATRLAPANPPAEAQ